MTHIRFVATAALLSLTSSQSFAQTRAHSSELGTVHFATSCDLKVVPDFDRGVALLHSFEFGAAIHAFDQVLETDSTCAMAHWGIALSRWGNPMAPGKRPVAQLRLGRQSIEAAIRNTARTSVREQGYIRAVAKLYDNFELKDQQARVEEYERAMRELVMRQPADTEARIFHAIALTASAPPTDKTYSRQLEAGKILERLWVKMPNHPGLAHYIIHSYDYPPLAGKARAAAERYAGIAPSAAHALHMPSHTFTRVGMWSQSASTNLRSMDVAVKAGSIAEALHAADYAVYAYLQLGMEAKAKAIIERLPALAARFDPNAVTGAAPGSAGVFALAAIPARWVLERGAWAEATSLTPVPSDFPYAEAMTYFVRAVGASHTGDLVKARNAIDSLSSIQQRLTDKGESYWAEQVAIQHLAAKAWLDLAEHRNESALQNMRDAVRREDATEKSAVSPGPLSPAREQLGDLLMALHRPAEALVEYRATLKKEPNRLHSLSRARN
jgi:hypothetical protein